MKTRLYLLFTCIVCLGLGIPSLDAQLNTASGLSATQLANTLVGPGVTVFNATLACPGGASGTFGNGNSTNIGLNTGVLLTSGSVANAPGPNNEPGVTTNNGAPGDADLTAFSGFPTFDRCVLEFDFEAVANTVSIRYVFASEEYLEWVNTQYNDVFAFLVSGPNPGGGVYTNVNIANVPNTNSPVSVNTINPGTNSVYYINNPEGGGTTIEYDGFTVVLTASIDIIPCETYHFKLAIADAGDAILDSGVFLEEASFEATLECQDIVFELGPDGTGTVDPEDLVASDLDACDFTFVVEPAYFVCSDEGDNAVTVTAVDPAGNVLTCDAIVTVVVPEGILDIDLGPACQTVYFGYGPAECTDITANVSGGNGPYTYLWSNGEVTQSITVCPEATTSYSVTVTDANGCTGEAGPVEIRVVDVHCGNNGDKVLVCHIPPDNPANYHTICVAAAAVPDHLLHGDFLGDCSATADPCSAPLAVLRPAIRPDVDNASPTIWPNPGDGRVVVNLPPALSGAILVELQSSYGEVLRQLRLPEGATTAEFTGLEVLTDGMYYIRVTDANEGMWMLRWMKLAQ